jgi:creatinine amidohydrolase/Fe(II)-dependent formamide hydrolase-like protein
MQLHLSTWPEVEAYLARSRGIVIPIGSTEQHGPNGLLGTDALCPEIIAREAGDGAAGDPAELLIGPTFNVGVAQHHLGFPGTITLRPSTMIAALGDWIASLSRHGFSRLYFLNGHGGNIATIETAFAEAYAAHSLKGEPAPFVCKLRNWWELSGVMSLATSLYPTGHGSHATPSEVAVTWYGYPAAVKRVPMSPRIAPEGPIRDAADYRARFPDGRIGSDPSQATVEHGERLVKAAAAALVAEARAFFAEDAPQVQAAAE